MAMAATQPTPSSPARAPKKCVVDKTIHTTLPFFIEDNETLAKSARLTPSASDGISPTMERLHRLHGTSLLLDAATLLCLPPSTYATACTILHRMYHRISLLQHCVWSMAVACTLLAGKVEEEPRTVRSIIMTFAHIYRRRRLRFGDDVGKYSYGAADCEAVTSALLVNDEKENILRSVKPMSMGGPVYAEWKDILLDMENVILKTLGFTLHWIPDSHPHKFILYFVRVIEIESKEVVQEAWNYCNDSCHLDLCVHYDPEVIACAAILMASFNNNVELPLLPQPWWEVFIGPNRNAHLSVVCNSILAVGNENELDIRRSKYAFVPSLMEEPSFNDPDSYLWSVAD
eukprot:CAMPEP_0172551814 /NCGR_PEP_ID=MMETSP1067-20121228/41186_1 /TAXON_ID=265564 ORGANISM="Thalassiosira punctigera, Strain Tpunct2005C2" /NCGR_SAMPLE_ID=MMETSP1067 /ASSEMBLY_ACC=CAM_ASM_000444 /LENGTH=344 /DNA_ID=CAMNT_0013339655 /DNA_START=19 /DNA_END=1053 /DNA_ORIENTATION=+